MPELRYDVHLDTPLGKRTGQLTAERFDGVLMGWLDILGHREPLEGTIDETDHCEITGTFTTLMRKVPFSATGQITEDSIHLRVKDKRNVFELSGTVCPKKQGR